MGFPAQRNGLEKQVLALDLWAEGMGSHRLRDQRLRATCCSADHYRDLVFLRSPSSHKEAWPPPRLAKLQLTLRLRMPRAGISRFQAGALFLLTLPLSGPELQVVLVPVRLQHPQKH